MARGLGTRSRFAIAYLLLGGAVGAALGFAIVFVQRPSPQPPPPWSRWRPVASDTRDQMLQIANHVGHAYRLPSGDQLVGIQTQSSSKIQGVAVVKADNPRALDEEYSGDDTAVYLFCGSPKTCAITEGKPSVARGTVLRREALELALYTLRYAKPIDNVLIFFPPLPGQKSLSSTLFFRRDDLSSALKHPLRKTLPQAQPPLPGKIRGNERQAVDELTGDKRFKYLGTVQNTIVIQPPA